MQVGKSLASSLGQSPVGRRLLAGLAPLLHWGQQLHKYVAVGCVVFLTDLLVYWCILTVFDSWFMYAHFISRSVGGVTCFALNRLVTFRKSGRQDLGGDAVRFLMLYGASFLLSSILIYAYVGTSLVPPVPGKVLAEFTVFIFNYTVMKYWVMTPRTIRQP